jgi:hypothetical protein
LQIRQWPGQCTRLQIPPASDPSPPLALLGNKTKIKTKVVDPDSKTL